MRACVCVCVCVYVRALTLTLTLTLTQGPRNIDMEIVKQVSLPSFAMQGILSCHSFAHSTVCARQVIGISQKYYPERLALSLMINVPVVFSSFWTLIKPLLDERTAAKVHFLSAEGAANFLPKLIDVAVLEKEYGGEHEPYPVLSEKMIAEFGPNPRDIAEAEAAGVDVQTVTVGARCVETFDVAITKAGEVQWCFKGVGLRLRNHHNSNAAHSHAETGPRRRVQVYLCGHGVHQSNCKRRRRKGCCCCCRCRRRQHHHGSCHTIGASGRRPRSPRSLGCRKFHRSRRGNGASGDRQLVLSANGQDGQV